MTDSRRFRMSKLTLGLAVALAAAPAFAQSTSAGVGGVVTSPAGQPAAGVEVTIVHVESGTVSRVTTDGSGRFNARGLRVGGPYTLTFKSAEGMRTEDNIYLSLNQVSNVNAALLPEMTTLETVTAVASAGGSVVFSADNRGVGTSVDGRQLEITPQGNRSLDDVARLDPRVTVLDPASGSISVAGVNNRFNTISVDGLSQGDPFGLNSNGLPYTNSPISVDTIAAYDINVADYDVAQDSVGAAINAVTKSGTNEFHGSVYYAYKDAGSMVASRNGQDYNLFDKDETTGVTIGGPIIKDKLFFFGSYEEQEVSDFGGGGATVDGYTRGVVSRAEIDEVIDIAKNVWGFDPGTYGESMGISLENKRYLGKIDWNINDNHRASLTYQQTEETLPSPYDQSTSGVILSTRWFTRESTTKNTSVQLFSDWTENFSTEVKIGYQKYDYEAGAAVNLPQINITTANNSSGSGQGVRLGEDRNRHRNEIHTERLTANVFGLYYAGDHAIKFGFDYLDNDALNLYGRDLHGTYVFNSIADFRAGRYYSYTVRRPAAGFSEEDTAASIGFSQWSPYIQDVWQVNSNLTLAYGLRANIPSADKAPPRNPGFEQAFGFANDFKLGSSNKVIMPRLSFNYAFDGDRYSQMRGGVGLFQTVPPFVWLANPYQNNGVNVVSFTANSYNPSYPFSPDPYNQPIPPNLTPAAASGQVDSIDPDFKLPTVWKASFGFDQELPWMGLVGSVEVQHLRNKHGLFYKALNIGEVQGQLGDGRDSYWCTMGGSTSATNKNCGRNPNFTYNSTVLTNTDQGHSTAFTISLDKPMANGWYGNISYTHTKASEVGSDGSSQAWSSYQYVSRLNPNEEIASTATREIRDSLKVSAGWERAFFGDYKTSFTAFYNGRSGLPYTWIINGDPNGDQIFQDPAYIPLVNDPLVSYVVGSRAATAAEIAAFHSAISNIPYLQARRGSIAERNGDRNPWVNQLDLGIQQELPGFFKSHKSVVRLDVYNFLNMLNKDWGLTENVGGFDTRYLAGLSRVNADGSYVYNIATNSPQDLTVYDASSNFPSRVVSRWSLLLTLRYQF